MRKAILYRYIVLILMTAALCVGGYYLLRAHYQVINPGSAVFSVHASSSELSVDIYAKSDAEYDVFLPSYADNAAIYNKSGYTILLDGTPFADGSRLTGIQYDHAYRYSCSNFWSSSNAGTIRFLKSSSTPVLSINTKSGSMEQLEADKTHEEKAVINALNPDGSVDFSGSINSIHGRGNNSWQTPKKSFLITFKTPVSILDLPSGYKFVLIPNYYDESKMSNMAAYSTSARSTIVTPSFAYTDIYFNGIYYGNYLITTKVDDQGTALPITDLEQETAAINDKKLKNYTQEDDSSYLYWNIPNSPSKLDSGYLLEFDIWWRAVDEKSLFHLENGQTITITEPKYASFPEVSYAANLMQELYDAVASDDGYNPATGKYYTDYIDLDSFVDKYLLDECFANIDSDTTSAYYWIEDGIVHAGPAWDYDLPYSTASGLMNTFVVQWQTNTQTNFPTIMSNCMKHDDFREALVQRYQQFFLPQISELVENGYQTVYDQYKDSFAMDAVRWYEDQSMEDGYSTVQSAMKESELFLQTRLAFLTDAWINKTDYVELAFEPMVQDVNNTVYAIRQGESFEEETPVPDIDGCSFLGWYYKDTDQEFDPDQPVTEDTELTARWGGGGC